MIKVYKQGITRVIPEKEEQKYLNFGYRKVDETHEPEPMVIKEDQKAAKTTK